MDFYYFQWYFMIEELTKNQNSIILTAPLSHNQVSPAQKPHFESLNLTEEQLHSRLRSLKDFQTYQKTKIQRIDLKQTEQMQKSLILDIVDRLGKKRTQNRVLADYVKSQIQETNKDSIKPRFPEKRKEGKRQMVSPIFINYKLKQKKQLGKVAKMLKHTTQQRNILLVQRCHSQSKTIPVNKEDSVQTPIPKELLKLKRSLKMHPVFKLKGRLTIDAYKYGSDLQFSQEQHPDQRIKEREIYSIEKDGYRKGNTQEIKKRESSLDLHTHRDVSYQQNASTKLLTFNSGKQTTPVKTYKQNLTTKGKIRLKINSILRQEVGTTSDKVIGRWPSYSEFDRSDDEAKIQKIILRFKRQTEKDLDLDQSHYRLHQKIEDQLRMQQEVIDQNALGERNPLGTRFNQFLKLEKEAFKKNLKNLENYRRFVKVEKQRHIIWANGLKRLKKY